MWFVANKKKPSNEKQELRKYEMIGKKREDLSGTESEEEEDKPTELPLDTTKKDNWETQLLDFTENPWIDCIFSIVILSAMINFREHITPDMLHFVSSMVDDEVHFICIMGYWLLWKCFLKFD